MTARRLGTGRFELRRPRLSDDAMVRRHSIDGCEKILIHDTRTAEAIELDPRQGVLIECADGTRDLDGIVLAASRTGALRRVSELVGLLGELADRGLMADGVAPIVEFAPSPPDRPVEALPGFRLHCNRNGACCCTYGSLLFTQEEAWRAHRLAPDACFGERVASAGFTAAFGTRREALAAPLVDGRCAYLDEDMTCRLHVIGGARAKPRACQTYPATFVDDGQGVRVSVSVECPCVLDSIGRDDGQPLVSSQVRVAGDLPEGTPVSRLADQVLVTSEQRAPSAALRAWAPEAARSFEGPRSSIDQFWALGKRLDEHGLDEQELLPWLQRAPGPREAELLAEIESLEARVKSRQKTVQWRSGHDRVRQLTGWLARVLHPLSSHDGLRAALDDERWEEHERFYARATLFDHRLALGETSLAAGCQARAVRIVVARGMGRWAADASVSDSAAAFPLTAVEVLMRHGLA